MARGLLAEAQAKLDAGISEQNVVIKTGNEMLKLANAKLSSASQEADATRNRLTDEYEKKQKTVEKLNKLFKT